MILGGISVHFIQSLSILRSSIFISSLHSSPKMEKILKQEERTGVSKLPGLLETKIEMHKKLLLQLRKKKSMMGLERGKYMDIPFVSGR